MKKANIILIIGLMITSGINACLPVLALETARLYIRPVQLVDAPAVANIALDPNVLKLAGLFPVLTTIEDVQGFVQNFLIGDSAKNISPRYPKAWAVVEKQSGALIGLVVFVAYLERHQKAEIAYAFAPAYWNNGYATEACQAIAQHAFDCGIVRLYATVDPENKASERVLQKMGMDLEGLMRSYMIINGKRVDRKMYAKIAGR